MWLGYPPASFLMFWPLLGWLSGTPARWLWAVTSVAMVIWLVRMIVSELHLKTRMERWSVLLYILAVYSTGITIGNGQIILHLLPPLLIGIVWLYQQPRRWNHDLIISVLLLFALIKPSVSVPVLLHRALLLSPDTVICGRGIYRADVLGCWVASFWQYRAG